MFGTHCRPSPAARRTSFGKNSEPPTEVTKTPVRPHPPMVTRRSSSRRWSEEERGGASTSFSSEDGDSVRSTPTAESPLPTRRLFHDGGSGRSFFSRSGFLQAIVIVALMLMSAAAWLPVFRYAMYGDALPAESRRTTSSSADTSSLSEPAPGFVYAFHEPGCAGESLALRRSADLCGQRFSSGVDAKDNIASVLLVTHEAATAALELVIYGTCALAEQPPNPMLLQIVRAQGCTDLKYPLTGSFELRAADPLRDAAAADAKEGGAEL